MLRIFSFSSVFSFVFLVAQNMFAPVSKRNSNTLAYQRFSLHNETRWVFNKSQKVKTWSIFLFICWQFWNDLNLFENVSTICASVNRTKINTKIGKFSNDNKVPLGGLVLSDRFARAKYCVVNSLAFVDKINK